MAAVKKDILWRVYVVFAFICVFGAAVVFRIWKLQNVEGDYWRAQADSLTTTYKTIEAARGNIYSHDDLLLATSVPIYDIRIDFKADAFRSRQASADISLLAKDLAGMFRDRTPEDFRRILEIGRRKEHRYYLLRRNVTHSQLKQLRTFPIFREGKFKGGFIYEQRNRRELPLGKLASRTIGQSRKNAPNVGIEGYFDEYLRGKDGIRLMQRISGGVLKPLNNDNEIEPRDGYDVITTLDARLQDVAEHALEERLQKHQAEAGCAILMEVATGEVRAIANLKRGADGTYHEEYNTAVGSSTEPGSTFKLISLVAAMEDRGVDLDDSVDTGDGKVFWTRGRPMRDSHEGGYGKVSVKHAFEVSSNVGISRIIHQQYARNPRDFTDRIRAMHVGEKIGLQIRGEGQPVIKDPDNASWSGTTLPYMSIGYECALTPLQMLTFYNAIANDGVMVKPLFVKALREKGIVEKAYGTQVIDSSICSRSTAAKAREMLEGVVLNGTATNLKHAQYRIAGKTGTARVANNRAGYTNLKYQASFVGYFPADKPRYSCMVVVYAPSNDVFYASQVAAPIFKDISDKVYATDLALHEDWPADTAAPAAPPVPKNGRTAPARTVFAGLGLDTAAFGGDGWLTVGPARAIARTGRPDRPGLVPDVTGMGLRDAILLLERAGLQVSVTGRGTVRKQSVVPGSPVVRGQHVIIELS